MHKLMSKLILAAITTVCLSLLIQAVSCAGPVSEEARRHIARGQAAMEMAKSPAELEDAINEFQKAARLAPGWPDPYYNLGIAQEKSGKLSEAVASFKRYLQLVPNAPNAAKIQEQIYKLEYKAEQVLSVPEIIDVLVSFKGGQWQKEGECWDLDGCLRFGREGHDEVKALVGVIEQMSPRLQYNTMKVIGPVSRITLTRNVCAEVAEKQLGDCTGFVEQEVEVVSKRLVKVNQKVLKAGIGNGASNGQRFSCTFQKK
jgi:hypothetical protein